MSRRNVAADLTRYARFPNILTSVLTYVQIRTPEDQAEYDRRQAEKAAGIVRRRGRPRKNPDYLIRDNRSKRLRALREAEMSARAQESYDVQQMHDVFELP